jgi:hypothetical protein
MDERGREEVGGPSAVGGCHGATATLATLATRCLVEPPRSRPTLRRVLGDLRGLRDTEPAWIKKIGWEVSFNASITEIGH